VNLQKESIGSLKVLRSGKINELFLRPRQQLSGIFHL
jgi:hypothetical protein